MLQWIMAGLAIFAAGSAAGFILSSTLPSPHIPAESLPKLAVVQASPAPAETPKSTTAFAPLPSAASEPLNAQPGASAPSRQTATKQRSSAGQVIIAAVKPDASPQREWAAPATTAAIKIAHVGGANPALQNNPIVMRELSRDIQQELYRVGCHSVSISGKWDHRTVKASARFVANRNATLPADRPDVVLLSLLRSYRGGSCGLTCSNAVGADLRCATPDVAASKTPALAALPQEPSAVAVPSTYSAGFETGEQINNTGNVSPPTLPRAAASRPTRSVTKRPARRRAAPRRKERLTWRQKIHYGYGSD